MADKERDFCNCTFRGDVVFDPSTIGKSGTKLRVRITRNRKNGSGGWDKHESYIDLAIFHPALAKYAAGLSKYTKVFVEGAVMEQTSFTDKGGNARKEWQASIPPFERGDVDFDIDRQLGTFGAKEPAYLRQPNAAQVPFDADVPF